VSGGAFGGVLQGGGIKLCLLTSLFCPEASTYGVKLLEKRLLEVFLYWPISLPYNLLRSRKLNDKDTGKASAALRSNTSLRSTIP
jgi:hypothetical protein